MGAWSDLDTKRAVGNKAVRRKPSKRGRKASQNTIIRLLEELGPPFQYVVTSRKRFDRYLGSKAEVPVDFRPDVFWEPAFGSSRQPRLWEVEKNVNASSVSKSVLSLLTSLSHFRLGGVKDVEGCLVVPEGKKKYVLGRARAAIRMIRQFGGQRKGAPRKIRLGVTAFEEVQRVARLVDQHERGAAPKLKITWARPE
jgi:hypothetical protein